jgi:hypothetical protein
MLFCSIARPISKNRQNKTKYFYGCSFFALVQFFPAKDNASGGAVPT